MVAKTAKTVKVVRSTKPVRVVKVAGGRSVNGNAKPVPSFPSGDKKPVNPWAPLIVKDFKEQGVRTSRTPQHTKPSGAALVIQRGGGAATKVSGSSVRADRVEKKRGTTAVAKTKVAKPQKPEKPLKFSKKGTVSIDATSIKAIAKLVKLQLEGKPITKRKQYPTRSSTIVRVPNEILELVKQQIAAYRRRKAEK